jgi:hypothetical protein
VIIADKIQIKKLGEGIALHAPSHGLQEVYLDANTLKVGRKILFNSLFSSAI